MSAIRPRSRAQRRLGRALASTATAVTLVAGGAVVAPPPASAATYAVPCGAAWLVAAVEQVNALPGGNTLNLAAGCTYTFTARYGTTEWALPPITGGLTINGNGATVERSTSAPSMGIASLSGDLLLSDVTLREFWGFNGAYFFVGGSLVLVDSLITNVPPTGQQEAALKVGPSGTLAVVDSTIERQTNFDDGDGGAIENAGYLAVSGSTFRNNTSYIDISTGGVGGAITNSGTAQIHSSTFDGNSSGGTGGHIRNAGSLTIDDSTFLGGSSNFGAAIANSSDLVVDDSYFEANDAAIGGGAIYNSSTGLATVRSSTFHRNRAGGQGGGALLNSHGANLSWSTFSQNTATSLGQSLTSAGGIIAAEGVILDGTGDHCSGSIADFGHDLVSGSLGSCPATFAVGAAQLAAPALHGGTTKTMALGAGSAAFDAAGSGCPTYDQRGRPRPTGAACDVGALEDQVPPAPGTPALAAASTSPNQGVFGLTWVAESDPDGTPVTYRLRHRRSDQASFTQVAAPSDAAHTFVAPEGEGRWTYDVIATDGNLSSSASAASSTVVVDRTGPSAPLPATDRDPDFVGEVDWWADAVTVSFAGALDPDLVDGTAGSGVVTTTSPQTFDSSGEHAASGNATDAAGNVSAPAALTVRVDATAPTIVFDACPADVVLGSSAQALWSAADAHAGLASPAAGAIALDTSTIGEKQVVAEATDNVGHDADATCSYRVVYDFVGFFRPLVNPPGALTVSAGSGVSVSFSLAGYQGLGVIAPGYPQSAPIPCGAAAELDAGVATSSRRGLTFTRGRPGQYAYLWATDPTWQGTCRQLVVKLADGTHHRANVTFE